MIVFKAMDQITMSGLNICGDASDGNMRGFSLRSTWNCQSFAELKSDEISGRFLQFISFGFTPSAMKRMRSGVDGLLRFAVATRSAITGIRRQRRLSCLQPYRPCFSAVEQPFVMCLAVLFGFPQTRQRALTLHPHRRRLEGSGSDWAWALRTKLSSASDMFRIW